MLGSFSNLKELDIKCDFMEVGSEGFYLDFIDAFTINGFRGLVNLNIQIGMNQISENMIFNLIDTISKHCLLLENLILPYKIIKRRKSIVQAAIFGTTWPNLKTIPQHLLQLQSFGHEALRYAILDGLSVGSLQFPQLDTLVFRECASVDVARAGLVLPEDMSHIKHLTIIGRALRNPFLMSENNTPTRFSGLETLDLSGLEFPECPLNNTPEVIPTAEFTLLKTEFDNRTRHCKRKLISSIPSVQLQSLKLGLTSFTCDGDGDSIVGGLDEILKQLKSLEIIGRNPMSWYESKEAFCEQSALFQLQNGLHQLRDGGELKFFHEHSYDEDPSDDFLEEEDNVTCIQRCLALLQKEYLRNNLLHLKVGRWLEIDWSFIIDNGGIFEVNDMLKMLYDDEDDDDNDSDDDDKDEDDDENKIKKKIFSRTAEVWAKTLSYYKRLKHFEMRNFDIMEGGVIDLIEKIALDPPLKLSTIIVRGDRNGRNQISQISRRQQKTIDCWIKPKRIIPIVPLDIVYINDETSLKETLTTLNIKRWGLREE